MKNKRKIIKAINELSTEINHIAVNHGFWDDGQRNIGEALMLIVSEASEALEAHRTDAKSDKIKGISGLQEELADVVIRTLDLAAGLKLDLASTIIEKIEYNSKRPFLHGKKY